MTQPIAPQGESFYGLGIAPKLLEALERLKFTTPTPIQRQAIPVAVEGKDIIGIAQTGTGKTLAFGIPMLQRLAQVGGKGLVLLPTRELALQVEETYQKIGRMAGLRTAVLIGGASMHRQLEMLSRKPHVIVATPGRLIDHMDSRKVDLSDVRILVLDEADRMLDMGFMPQIRRILEKVPRERQTMLFSATMPETIVGIAARHMKMPVRVEIARAGTAADRVTHELFVVRKDQKNRLLDKLLAEQKGSVLVFTRTKFAAHKLVSAVRSMGHAGAEIHSDRSLSQRREALDGFKSGKYRVLIATDIAARGIDVTGIELVLNYDIPENPEDYVHRIGRTARAGREGKAISFATPEQGALVRDIEKLTRIMLRISSLPELPPDRPMPPGTGRKFVERPRREGPSSSGQRRDGRDSRRRPPRPPSRGDRGGNRGGGKGGIGGYYYGGGV